MIIPEDWWIASTLSRELRKGQGKSTCRLVVLMNNIYMGVSKNNGTPKSSILIGFSIINHPFWGTPIFGNTHMTKVLNINLVKWYPAKSDQFFQKFKPFLLQNLVINCCETWSWSTSPIAFLEKPLFLQGSLYYQPKQCIVIMEIPQNCHRCVFLFISPKWVPFNDPCSNTNISPKRSTFPSPQVDVSLQAVFFKNQSVGWNQAAKATMAKGQNRSSLQWLLLWICII